MPDDKKLLEKYHNHPITRVVLATLSTAFPAITIGQVIIEEVLSKAEEDRKATFLDELANGDKLLTQEMAQSEEFVHSLLVVYRASMRSYQRKKIRRFAQILLHAIGEDELASEKLEEFTRILGNLHESEVVILHQIHNIQGNYPQPETTDLGGYLRALYERFEKHILGDDIAEDDLRRILFKLEGLGLYKTIASGMSFGGERTVLGKVTDFFKEFAEWIKLESDMDEILYGKDTVEDL